MTFVILQSLIYLITTISSKFFIVLPHPLKIVIVVYFINGHLVILIIL